jgi:hypothetical protein
MMAMHYPKFAFMYVTPEIIMQLRKRCVKATEVVEVEVTLQLTVSQSVCLGIEHPCGTCDQILTPG